MTLESETGVSLLDFIPEMLTHGWPRRATPTVVVSQARSSEAPDGPQLSIIPTICSHIRRASWFSITRFLFSAPIVAHSAGSDASFRIVFAIAAASPKGVRRSEDPIT